MSSNGKHCTSLLVLIPGALITAFYTPEGVSAARLLSIGLLIDALWPSTTFVLLFTAAAISNSVSAASSRLVQHFDFFSLFGLIQTLLNFAATCGLIALKNSRKPGMLSYFAVCGVIAVSLSTSLSYAALFFFPQSAPLFAAITMACGRVFWELLVQQCRDYYDNERFGPGLGVERTAKGGLQLQQGLSYFETIRKQNVRWAGISFSVLAVAIPVLFNIFGNYYQGFGGTMLVVGVSVCAFLMVVGLLYMIQSKKQIRSLGLQGKDAQPTVKLVGAQEVEPLTGDDKLVKKANQNLDAEQTCMQRLKVDLTKVKQCGKRELLWVGSLTILYILGNLAFYGTKQHAFYYCFAPLFAFLSAKAILEDCSTYDITLLLLATPLLLNQPLPLLLHYLLHAAINASEQRGYSTLLLIAAGIGSMVMSSAKQLWWFLLPACGLYCLTQTHILPQSRLGAQVIIYAHSLALDLLISLPKNYMRNILCNGFVGIALVVYAQKFMRPVVGREQSGTVVLSIMFRLVVNTLNGFLLTPSVSQDQKQILQILVKWNGWFAFGLSLLLQILSGFQLGERVSGLKYLFLAPLFIAIATVVAATPLNVVVVDLVLFVTGFSQIFTFRSSNLIQEVSFMVYQAFYRSISSFGLDWLIWTCRILAGVFVASLALMIINQKSSAAGPRKKFSLENPFLPIFFAAFFGLFVAVPSAIAQLGEIQEFPWVNCLVIALTVIAVALMPVIQTGAKFFKFAFLAAYAILVVVALATQMYSEGFVLTTFLMMLWFLPQTFVVFSFIIAVLFLVVLINVRYSVVTITYQSAISTFSLITILFIARYQMVKSSCLRRLTKRARVEHVGCKINSGAFGLEETEMDVFLMDDSEQERAPAPEVYESLSWQMYTFIFLSTAILYQWNFYPLIAVLFSLLTLLIPVDSRDSEGKLTQVAGYFGALEGWQLTELNKLSMKQRFGWTLYALLLMRVLLDIMSFVGLYASDRQGYGAGLKPAAVDFVCLIVCGALGFAGLALITGTPTRVFRTMYALQHKKLMVIATAISVAFSILATNKAIKLLPTFCVAALAFTAPAGLVEAEATGQKRVVSIPQPDV